MISALKKFHNDRNKSIELLVKRNGPGLVVLEECPLCGILSWISTRKAEHTSFVIRRAEHLCYTCTDVRYRNTEFFNWVLNVIAFNTELKETK